VYTNGERHRVQIARAGLVCGCDGSSVRYLVVANASMLQPSLRKGLAASAPFFRILRALKKL
jgi:hypothetical protein